MTARRCDDLGALLPTFRGKVEALIAALKARGHRPIVWETYRSAERAAALAKRGTGIRDSMHTYKVAADLLCQDHLWDCFERGCDFYVDLRDVAEKMGLTSGARFRRKDWPHVQAVRVIEQTRVRRMGDEARERYLQERDAKAA